MSITKPSDVQSLDKLVKFGVKQYFEFSTRKDLVRLDSLQENWKKGIQWFKLARSKIYALETDENTRKFEKIFEIELFEIIQNQWTEIYDRLSYTQLCSVYSLYSIVVSNDHLVKHSKTWYQRVQHLKEAISLSIEAAFINDSCVELKNMIRGLKTYVWQNKIKGDKITIDAVIHIENVVRNLTERLNPKGDPKMFQTLMTRVCEE